MDFNYNSTNRNNGGVIKMNQEESKRDTIKNLALMTLIFLLVCVCFGLFLVIQENILYKIILNADAGVLEVSVDAQKATLNYNEASLAYEDNDYNQVERSCRLARDYYFSESQGYKKVSSELRATGNNDKLITLYLSQMGYLSDISTNMYEACEHFESAARYYDKYYLETTPADDPSYESGGEQIEMMNKKIEDHDRNVEAYNQILQDYRVELEVRLGK